MYFGLFLGICMKPLSSIIIICTEQFQIRILRLMINEFRCQNRLIFELMTFVTVLFGCRYPYRSTAPDMEEHRAWGRLLPSWLRVIMMFADCEMCVGVSMSVSVCQSVCVSVCERCVGNQMFVVCCTRSQYSRGQPPKTPRWIWKNGKRGFNFSGFRGV